MSHYQRIGGWEKERVRKREGRGGIEEKRRETKHPESMTLQVEKGYEEWGVSWRDEHGLLSRGFSSFICTIDGVLYPYWHHFTYCLN